MVFGGELLLPAEHVLGEDLGVGLEALARVGQETGSYDDGVWAHYFLVVVDVGGAAGGGRGMLVLLCVCLCGI